jgi:hypothetical protein
MSIFSGIKNILTPSRTNKRTNIEGYALDQTILSRELSKDPLSVDVEEQASKLKNNRFLDKESKKSLANLTSTQNLKQRSLLRANIQAAKSSGTSILGGGAY